LLAQSSLTGVIDRLESKGLIERQAVPYDRCATYIRLTRKGEALYPQVFPAQSNLMCPCFERALTKQEIFSMQGMFLRLRDSCRKE
jgi:DNA-binding MarR family transcriptional regulator